MSDTMDWSLAGDDGMIKALAARVRALEQEVLSAQEQIDDLRTALRALDYLLHPDLMRFLRNMTGGPVCDLERDTWRLRGFHNLESPSVGQPYRWSDPGLDCAILFFLVQGEVSHGQIFASVPKPATLDSLVADIDGEALTLEHDEESEVFAFAYTARRTGWHALRLMSQPYLPATGIADHRRLGFVLRGAQMLPQPPVRAA